MSHEPQTEQMQTVSDLGVGGGAGERPAVVANFLRSTPSLPK